MLLEYINCNKSLSSQTFVVIFIAHARCLICQPTTSLSLGSQIVGKAEKQKILMLSTANDPQYIDMCRCDGYGFQAVYIGIGYTNLRNWV